MLRVTRPHLQELVARFSGFGERPAVGLRGAFGARWWSYRRLQEESFRFAARLEEWGIPTGARILLWAPNTPEWVAALFGSLLRGVVVVPVDEAASAAYVERLAGQVEPAALFQGPEQPLTRLEAPAFRLYDVVRGKETGSDPDLAAPIEPTTALGADHLALIIYTSGTSQEPKGVILTHGNLSAQMRAFDAWRRLLRILPLRLLALSPLSHVQGLMLGALIPLSVGLSVLYSESVEPHRVIRTIRQNRVTLLLAVPRVQHLLADVLRSRPTDRDRVPLGERMRRIRFFLWRRHISFRAAHSILGYSFWVLLVGGATLPPADERFWYDCGFVLVQGYGLTETTALISVKINAPFFTKLGSIGRPIGRQEIRLTEEGEILVAGENVSPGYFRNEAADREGFRDGFLRSGDLAGQDDKRRLFLWGRRKEVIVTGEGLNVYPQEVESVLNRLAGVRDSAVLGLADDDLPEVHAVLLLTSGAQAVEIVSQANTQLEPHQRIRGWTVWPESDLPRTSLLKVRREVVARRLEEMNAASRSGQPAAPASEARPTPTDILESRDHKERLELLAGYLSRPPPAAPGLHEPEDGPVSEDLHLIEDLGLSSLDVVELLTMVERERPVLAGLAAVRGEMTLGGLKRAISDSALPRRQERQGGARRLPLGQPAWSGALPGRAVRRISQPLLIGLWSRFIARVSTHWQAAIRNEDGPWLIAGAPHHNWLDSFVIYSALPRRWRRQLVTVTNRDFAEFFTPGANTPDHIRREVGLAYYLLWPMVFEFVIVPNFGPTREGLYELGRYIDRGYSPITFPKGLTPPGGSNPEHEAGMAHMALQTGLPILPLWIQGNENLQIRPKSILRRRPDRLSVWIGEPVRPEPFLSAEKVVDRVEAAFARLAAAAGSR
jgi:long-chain acyl-CoA synthetase